jgi:SAM-dependent methyltransferase
MWGIETERQIQEILEQCDEKYKTGYALGFFYRANPLFLTKIFMREALSFLLNRNISASARILDLGCGTAQMLLLLRQFGYRNLHGWDANKQWLLGARELFARLADAECVQLRTVDRDAIYDIKAADPEAFDVITMFGLLCDHGIDLDRALSSARDALKPGGILIFNEWRSDAEAVLASIERAGLAVNRRVQVYSGATIENNVYFCGTRQRGAGSPRGSHGPTEQAAG